MAPQPPKTSVSTTQASERLRIVDYSLRLPLSDDEKLKAFKATCQGAREMLTAALSSLVEEGAAKSNKEIYNIEASATLKMALVLGCKPVFGERRAVFGMRTYNNAAPSAMNKLNLVHDIKKTESLTKYNNAVESDINELQSYFNQIKIYAEEIIKNNIENVASSGSLQDRIEELNLFSANHPGEPLDEMMKLLFPELWSEPAVAASPTSSLIAAVGVVPSHQEAQATIAEVGPLPTRSELAASRRTFAARREAARQAGGTLKIIDHLRDVWGPWIAAGVLTRADLLHADPSAYSSLTQWLRREGNDLKAALGHDIPTKSEATRSKITPEAIKEARRISSLAARIGRTD